MSLYFKLILNKNFYLINFINYINYKLVYDKIECSNSMAFFNILKLLWGIRIRGHNITYGQFYFSSIVVYFIASIGVILLLFILWKYYALLS